MPGPASGQPPWRVFDVGGRGSRRDAPMPLYGLPWRFLGRRPPRIEPGQGWARRSDEWANCAITAPRLLPTARLSVLPRSAAVLDLALLHRTGLSIVNGARPTASE
jgi:hypothetical protein